MGHSEKLKEDYREREVDYHKDFQAEDFEEEPRQGSDLKARISEFSEVVHGFEIKFRESLAGSGANPNTVLTATPCQAKQADQGRSRAHLVIASAALALAILLAAGVFAHYNHRLELERLRILERAGSHEICLEERARLLAQLESVAQARVEAEQALARLQSELAAAATTRRAYTNPTATTAAAAAQTQPSEAPGTQEHTTTALEAETSEKMMTEAPTETKTQWWSR